MIYTKKITLLIKWTLIKFHFWDFFSGFLELNANLIQEKKGPTECILSIFFRCIMIRVSGVWAMMKKLEHFFEHYTTMETRDTLQFSCLDKSIQGSIIRFSQDLTHQIILAIWKIC